MSEFKKGDVVNIYRDLYTKQKLEGKANITSHPRKIGDLDASGNNIWRADVIFIGHEEDGKYSRDFS